MLCLFIRARFAAFRTFATGSFRPTAPFITPSAAYGLALNLAGVEMRNDDGKSPMTQICDKGLPKLDVALGAPADGGPWKWGSVVSGERTFLPRVHDVDQQLHNYPVGPHRKEHAPHTMGAKYNVTPVRRSVLSGLEVVACFRHDDLAAFDQKVRAGLRGEAGHRYGLPFLGDNNFLPDRIEVLHSPPPCHWFVPVLSGDVADDWGPPARGVGRLTVTIDRLDSSRTRSRLFGPTAKAMATIPGRAWVCIDYSA